jgi:hypothetical protein
MRQKSTMGRLKKRTADPLLNAAADAAQPPETNCRVDKSGPSQELHKLPFAGSNPAPATTLPHVMFPDSQAIASGAKARVESATATDDLMLEECVAHYIKTASWHGPRLGLETVEQHQARWLRAMAESAHDEVSRNRCLVAAARLDGLED